MGILVKLVLLLLSINVEARPISYSGGSTAMLITDNMKDSIYYHYSPTYKYSVGIEKVRDRIFDQEYSYLRFTYLMNRKIHANLKEIYIFNQEYLQRYR